MVGTLLSEVFCSGRLSDWLVVKLAARSGSGKTPEMRLWLVYPAAIVTSLGLIMWGISIDRDYHWIVGQVSFVLCESMQQICSRQTADHPSTFQLGPGSRWATQQSLHMC
jgi:hypothetical protein